MPIQLPDNLHPDCGPVVWLLGEWGGTGRGDYPDIEAYSYAQEAVFQQDGRAFFHYFSRSWIVDEAGEKVAEGAQETGFLRCRPGGEVEFLLVHDSGHAEVWYGRAADGKVELHTAGVSYTDSAQEVTAGHRLYGNVEGDLLYAYDMEAGGHALQPRLWARLERR